MDTPTREIVEKPGLIGSGVGLAVGLDGSIYLTCLDEEWEVTCWLGNTFYLIKNDDSDEVESSSKYSS